MSGGSHLVETSECLELGAAEEGLNVALWVSSSPVAGSAGGSCSTISFFSDLSSNPADRVSKDAPVVRIIIRIR
ncbi:hypothetical protein FHT02_004097 [Sphingomonas xinjiangensis]|uniref:Uncharacterized protein n=1 Tax=Sphingomonas xinjiangensis TaxID=643568 RepID=A0A840YT07_9SPHN|nr:hypothetical protein [Sphingomonas xinjiangensis]